MIYSIFFSPQGGTKRVADLLTEPCPQVTKIDLIKDKAALSNISFNKEDIAYVAVPSFSGRIPSVINALFADVRGNGAKAVLIAVYGNRAFEDTLIELKDLLTGCGFNTVAAVAANAEHSIMHQYATGRPDKEDTEELKEFALKIKEHLQQTHIDLPSVDVPGNHPYRPVGSGSIRPIVNQKCIGCNLCAKECPAKAIPIVKSKPSETTEKCIGCMHCIALCPLKARELDSHLVNALAEKMKPAFAQRKQNQLFI